MTIKDTQKKSNHARRKSESFRRVTWWNGEVWIVVRQIVLPCGVVLGAHGVVVVDLLADPLPLAQGAGHVLLLLLIVVAEELLPVGRIRRLNVLFQDLGLGLLGERGYWVRYAWAVHIWRAFKGWTRYACHLKKKNWIFIYGWSNWRVQGQNDLTAFLRKWDFSVIL